MYLLAADRWYERWTPARICWMVVPGAELCVGDLIRSDAGSDPYPIYLVEKTRPKIPSTEIECSKVSEKILQGPRSFLWSVTPCHRQAPHDEYVTGGHIHWVGSLRMLPFSAQIVHRTRPHTEEKGKALFTEYMAKGVRLKIYEHTGDLYPIHSEVMEVGATTDPISMAFQMLFGYAQSVSRKEGTDHASD